MELVILKKKIDGYRAANGSIKNLAPELLMELRHTWENYTGTIDQFRSELGVKTGTLRNLLVESKKLNHVIASAGMMAIDQGGEVEADGQNLNNGHTHNMLEFVYDRGEKVIRFPSVDLLVDFLRKSA